MIAIAFLFVCVLCDCFKSRRRLEAEILVLRHQLKVLQQRAPRRLHLHWAEHIIEEDQASLRLGIELYAPRPPRRRWPGFRMSREKSSNIVLR